MCLNWKVLVGIKKCFLEIVYISSYYTIKYAYYEVCYMTFLSFVRFIQDLKGCVTSGFRIDLMRFCISCKCNLNGLMIEIEAPAVYKEKKCPAIFCNKFVLLLCWLSFLFVVAFLSLICSCFAMGLMTLQVAVSSRLRCVLLKAYEKM